MSGADIVILLRNDLALSVFADKHSRGTSPERGFDMYFSASLHFEFRVNPSPDKYSHVYTVFACNAAIKNKIKIQTLVQKIQYI